MDTVRPLNTKEISEMRKIDRLQMAGRATRTQLLRGMALHHRHNAAFRETNNSSSLHQLPKSL